MAFQPLTQEQYQKAIDSGFSPDQIISFEKQRKANTPDATGFKPSAVGGMPSLPSSIPGSGIVNTLENVGAGMASTIGQAGVGLASAAAKGVGGVSSLIGDKPAAQFWNNVGDTASALGTNIFKNPVQQNTSTLPGAVGQGIGQAALLASPTKDIAAAKGAIAPATSAVRTAISGVPLIGKAAGWTAQQILNAIPEASFGFLYGKSQGQSNAGAAGTAAGFGAASAAFGAAGTALSGLKNTFEQNLVTSLGIPTGVKSANQTQTIVPTMVRGLKTIANLAPQIKVVDEETGAKVPFDPAKATYDQFMQAIGGGKEILYKAYSDLAAKAGDLGAQFTHEDFNSLISAIQPGGNTTSGFKRAASSLVQDIIDNYSVKSPGKTISFNPTSITDIQEFLQNVNKDVNPQSDSAGAQTAITAASKIRDIMDAKIENSAGAGYQRLRDGYSAIRAIEKQAAQKWSAIQRQTAGKGIPTWIERIGIINVLSSAATLFTHPFAAVRGLAEIGLGEYTKAVRDPEAALQSAFKEIMGTAPAPSAASVRTFGVMKK